jgi:branched-subunit amino acid transport protein
MTDVWITIGALVVITAAIKGAGPAFVGGRNLPPTVTRVIALFAPALLAALIIVETLGGPGPSITLDERAAGVLAAAGVLVTTRSMIGAVVIAALTTAGMRAIT